MDLKNNAKILRIIWRLCIYMYIVVNSPLTGGNVEGVWENLQLNYSYIKSSIIQTVPWCV